MIGDAILQYDQKDALTRKTRLELTLGSIMTEARKIQVITAWYSRLSGE